MLTFEPHPLLHPAAFTTTFPAPLARVDGNGLAALLTLEADAPVARDEERRKAVRDLLRHGGYEPTGRGKPSCGMGLATHGRPRPQEDPIMARSSERPRIDPARHLVLRLRGLDPAALRCFFDCFFERIYTRARRTTPDVQGAERLTESIFAQLRRSLPELADDADLEEWVDTIVVERTRQAGCGGLRPLADVGR